MKNTTTSPKTCTATMKLLGDYWTLRIIDALREGETRFCELQRTLDNLNPVTLTNRLKRLERAMLVERHEESLGKASVAYTLTNLGREALAVVRALNRFSTIDNS